MTDDTADPDGSVKYRDGAADRDLEPQPVPERARCPACGGPATVRAHVLSALGYTHDDQSLACADCGERWSAGVPIGEPDADWADDLRCPACDEAAGLVHRVEAPTVAADGEIEAFRLHLKCPECAAFWQVRRTPGPQGTALVGYPQTTGAVADAAAPYGYPPADAGSTADADAGEDSPDGTETD